MADQHNPNGVDSSRKITSVAEFCAEADRIGLTAADLAEALSKRPEFADCLPSAGVQEGFTCPVCGQPNAQHHPTCPRNAGVPPSRATATRDEWWDLLNLASECELWARQVSKQPDVRRGIRDAGSKLSERLRDAISAAMQAPRGVRVDAAPFDAFKDLAGRLGWDTEQKHPGGLFRDSRLQALWDGLAHTGRTDGGPTSDGGQQE